jgi:hypothetical protein
MKNIFDVIKNLTYIKNEDDLNTEFFNPYMINRYLTMDENYFIYGLLMNRYSDIPKEYQERFMFLTIPKKYTFLKYVKKNSNFKEESVQEISDKYNISLKKSVEILEFLNQLNNKKNGIE